MIIDCAAYVDGKRVDVDTSCIPTPGMLPPSMAEAEFDDTDAAPRWDAPDGFVWLGLRMPDVEELSEWCDALDIDEVDPAAVLAPHARPVLTVNGTTVQLVLRTIRYDDHEEIASLGEMTLLVRPHSIVTIRHGPTSPLGELRQALERDHAGSARAPPAVMVAVIGRVIDDYGPALDGFETDAIEVEGEVFSDSSRQPVRRLYQLKRELRRMFVALDALQDPLDRLMRVFEDHLSREVLADLRENADQLSAGRGPRPFAVGPARLGAHGEPHPDLGATERRHAQDQRLGRHGGGADDGGRHLRHELRHDARTPIAGSATRWC